MDNSAPAKEETQNYHHLLQKLSVPLQLPGCTEKADCATRRVSFKQTCVDKPEYIPLRHRRQLAQSMWITEINHIGMPQPCGDRGVKRKAKLH